MPKTTAPSTSRNVARLRLRFVLIVRGFLLSKSRLNHFSFLSQSKPLARQIPEGERGWVRPPRVNLARFWTGARTNRDGKERESSRRACRSANAPSDRRIFPFASALLPSGIAAAPSG